MSNTNLETTSWDNAESNFQSWLKGNVKNETDTFSDIIKTTYLLTRNRLKKLLGDYCDNSLEYLSRKERLTAETRLKTKELLFEPKIQFEIIRLSVEEKNKKIIEGLTAGDQEVFNELYEYEFPKIVNLVIQNTGSVDNAKDVFQDALVILLEKVYYKELNLSCSIGTYLYAISQNLWFTALRRNKFFISLCKLSYNNSELDTIIIEDENIPENIDVITKAIESLGKPCKRLLELFYYLNESWDDIATILGYSNGASARNQKYKCLEKIRKQLSNS